MFQFHLRIEQKHVMAVVDGNLAFCFEYSQVSKAAIREKEKYI